MIRNTHDVCGNPDLVFACWAYSLIY